MIIEEVKIQTNDSTKTVRELKQELKELKDQLLDTAKGTDEYNSALKRSIEIQKELKDKMVEVNKSAIDFDQVVGNVTKTMTGMSGAITAATGALSLFGTQNEEAKKKITDTMSSLVDITQGLSKMDDGAKAFDELTEATDTTSKTMSEMSGAVTSTTESLSLLNTQNKEVNKSVTETTTSLKNMNQGLEDTSSKASTGNKTVKELRQELKDLKDQLLNTQKGTEEYSEAMQKAANIQKELKDQMLEVNNSAMDFGQKVGNITKTMSGLSGAITAATGAMSLFGVENEEAQKKITATMTSLIGITQGLSKLDDGVKAFRRLTIAINASSKSLNLFKTALISTGIGALVVVLGSVIAYWDEFTEAIGLSSEKMEHLGDVAKGVFNVITSSLKGISSALGKMIKGDFKGAWEELKDGFSVVNNFNEGVANSQAKREEEMTKKAKEEADKRAKIAEDEYKKRIAAAEKLARYEKEMAEAKLRGDEAEKYSEESRKIQERYFERMFTIYKKDSEEYRNLVLEKEKWLQDWENHFMAEAKKEEDENQKRLDDEKKTRQNILNNFYESLKSEEVLLEERYNTLIEAARKENKDTTDITEWYEKEKTRIIEDEAKKRGEVLRTEQEIYQSYLLYGEENLIGNRLDLMEIEYKMAIEAAQKLGEDTLKIDEKYAKLKKQLWGNTYRQLGSSVGDIIGSISDMMDEGSEEQKGLAIAATTIQMLVGIQTALSGVWTTHTGVWDIALAAAQAASIAASGMATISKINQVKPDGSGSGSAASVPSVSIPTVINTSSDFTQSVDGAMTRSTITDQRVYVLEHDITETQNKVEVAEQRATY